MKRQIILSGELGKKFGKIHHLAVATAAEAVRAFCANYPEFERFVIDSAQRNVGYKVFVQGVGIQDTEELHHPAGQGSICICPVIAGSKKGGFAQLLIGAALIGAAFIPGLNVAVFSGAAGFLASTTYASVAFGLGVSLALGGVTQLISPQAKSPGPAEAANNKPSYTFNGPVNTVAQGQPVPVGYGRLIIGSALISTGESSDNLVST